jgi:hypothetical protein
MTNFVPPFVFSPGTVIQSAQVNSDFTAAATVINGNLDHTNLSSSAGITGTQLSATAGIVQGQLAPILGPVMGGRLTGVTGAPFGDTSTTTATIFYTPAYSSYIAIQNTGNNLIVVQTFTQASLAVGALTTSSMYDVYVTSTSSTTVALNAVIWTNATTPPTRGVDVANRLTQNGNAGALLVGSIYIGDITANTTSDNGGSRCINNVYNKVQKHMSMKYNGGASTGSASFSAMNSTRGTGAFGWCFALADTGLAMNASVNGQASAVNLIAAFAFVDANSVLIQSASFSYQAYVMNSAGYVPVCATAAPATGYNNATLEIAAPVGGTASCPNGATAGASIMC